MDHSVGGKVELHCCIRFSGMVSAIKEVLGIFLLS